jgi:hypothetical protein
MKEDEDPLAFLLGLKLWVSALELTGEHIPHRTCRPWCQTRNKSAASGEKLVELVLGAHPNPDNRVAAAFSHGAILLAAPHKPYVVAAAAASNGRVPALARGSTILAVAAAGSARLGGHPLGLTALGFPERAGVHYWSGDTCQHIPGALDIDTKRPTAL